MKASRASLGHWLVVLVVFVITVPLVTIISFAVFALIFGSTVAISIAIACGSVFAGVLVMKTIPADARAAEWVVDEGGFQSDQIGRCEFADIEAVFHGMPRTSGTMRWLFQMVIAKGSDLTFDRTIVVRSKDGRLLPINLLSPGIHGGSALMSRLSAALAGKIRPTSEYTKAEIHALRGLTLNRWITPRNI